MVEWHSFCLWPEIYFSSNPTHVHIVFQNALNWQKWNLDHVSKCMYSDSFVIDGLPSTNAHFHPFCLSQVFSSFSRILTAFELGKQLKNSRSIFDALDAIFNTLEFHSTFPQCNTKFDADILVFQVSKFLAVPDLHIEHHMVLLNKPLLRSHMCCTLVPRMWQLWRLCYLHLVVKVHGSGSGVIFWSIWKLICSPPPYFFSSHPCAPVPSS